MEGKTAIRSYSSELYHYALKHANKDFKYIKKEMVNGKMRYYYDPDVKKGTVKTAAASATPNKNTTPVSNVSKLRNPGTNKTMAVNKDTKTGSPGTAKKVEPSTKNEPWVSDEYKQELEYNSKKNSFTDSSGKKSNTSSSIDYKEYDKQYQEAESKKLFESSLRPWTTDLNEVDRGDEDSVRGYIDAITHSLEYGYEGNEVYTSGVVELWNDKQSRDAVFKECMSKIETVAKKATSAKENLTDNIDRMLLELEDIMMQDVKQGELSIEEGERLIELKIYVKNMTRAYDEIFWRYNKSGDFNISESDQALMNTCLTNAVYGFLDYMTYCEKVNKQHKGKSIFEKLFKR